MNRKKCYCSNKFCKCLFGCSCTVSSNVTGKCLCCIMEENDKRLLRRGRVVNNECKCNFDEPKFYDIIVFNVDGYWSCRYGCMVTINDGDFDPDDKWSNNAVDPNNPDETNIKITYNSSINTPETDVNVLIVKEEDIKHVWCKLCNISDSN